MPTPSSWKTKSIDPRRRHRCRRCGGKSKGAPRCALCIFGAAECDRDHVRTLSKEPCRKKIERVMRSRCTSRRGGNRSAGLRNFSQFDPRSVPDALVALVRCGAGHDRFQWASPPFARMLQACGENASVSCRSACDDGVRWRHEKQAVCSGPHICRDFFAVALFRSAYAACFMGISNWTDGRPYVFRSKCLRAGRKRAIGARRVRLGVSGAKARAANLLTVKKDRNSFRAVETRA